MKRLTETTKWRDPWFRRLAPRVKLLWLYLCDNCDNAGVIDLDVEAASFDIGQSVDESHLTEFGDRVKALGNGKLWVAKFTTFQFGLLQQGSPVHRSVLKLIQSHGLEVKDGATLVNGYPYPRLPLLEKEKEKEKVQRGCGGDEKQALEIYGEYPRKIARPSAIRAINKALTVISFDELLAKTKLYSKSRVGEDPAFTPHPATWFNQERYNDDPTTWKRGASPVTRPNPRNAGTATPITDYGTAKPRLQRELEEKERLAGQVAEAKNQSSATSQS